MKLYYKHMKKLFILTVIFLLCMRCEKESFDIDNPDVEKFVFQIKNGTYSCYETGENDENLWLLMPNFTEKHIQSLMDFSKDTTHITAYPFNPISSRTPFPEGRAYCILGECLLWTIEGIRNGSGYGSLDPYIIDTSINESESYSWLNGHEFLIVQGIYEVWWNTHKETDWQAINPLEETAYIWF